MAQPCQNTGRVCGEESEISNGHNLTIMPRFSNPQSSPWTEELMEAQRATHDPEVEFSNRA